MPTPTPNTLFAADASGVAGWRLASAVPAFQAKADKDGAVVTRMVSPWVDLGNIAANAIATINVQSGSVQRFAALGNYTVAFTNLPAGVVALSLRLRCEAWRGAPARGQRLARMAAGARQTALWLPRRVLLASCSKPAPPISS